MKEIVYPAMEELLPHRPPMILIDRLVETDGRETICEVTPRLHDLFATDLEVPLYVGIEYMAQTVAAHGGYQSYQAGEPISVGLLMGTRRLECYCRGFEFGQTLRIHVAHIWGKAELMRFRCWILKASTSELCQQAELNVFKPRTLLSYLEKVHDDD